MPLDALLPPTIDCWPLPALRTSDLAAVRAAFADATPIPLCQAWLDTPDRDFAPGQVRAGWRHRSLLVFAELSDNDVFTRALRHNDRFWQLGDTFEMFLQPPEGQAYVELHVSPNNLRLQLRFAAPTSGDSPESFGAARLYDNGFDSRTWVKPEVREWCVLAEIPAASVFGQDPGFPDPADSTLAGSTWRFSFSRYDYTRGREKPVISSSSPHTAPAFHRPHEWGFLRFCL